MDVLKLKAEEEEVPPVRVFELPPLVGRIMVPSGLRVGDLANMLKQRPSRIAKDVLKLFGRSVTARHTLDFFEIEQVVRLYGFTATQTS